MTQHRGGRGWRVVHDEPSALIHALYARDASGLAAQPHGYVVPPLDPPVAAVPRLVAHASTQAAGEWADWWQSEAELGLAPAPDQPELWFAGRRIGPDLRQILLGSSRGSNDWRNDHRDGPAHYASVIQEVVDDAAREAGHAPRPFTLKISALPVRGSWGQRTSHDSAMISREMRHTPDALARYLRPIIRELL